MFQFLKVNLKIVMHVIEIFSVSDSLTEPDTDTMNHMKMILQRIFHPSQKVFAFKIMNTFTTVAYTRKINYFGNRTLAWYIVFEID